MNRVAVILLLASMAASGCRRDKASLYPTHIEAPDYNTTAHVAHIMGKVVVQATIDASGNVIDATASGQPMLAKFAIENIRRWTFERPKHAPMQQAVLYDYELEDSEECEISPTRVSFDLPGRVVIAARTVTICDPIAVVKQSRRK
jgi:hypothetical protein